MKYLKLLSSSVSYIEKSLVIFMLSVMILLAFLQVILRNFFSTGILWIDPLLRHFVLWIGFLGASLATLENRHINIDILNRFLSPKFKSISGILINLFAAVVCYFLLDASYTFLKDEISAETIAFKISGVEIYTWHMQIIILIGFGIMLFRFILRSLECIIKVFSKTAKGEPA